MPAIRVHLRRAAIPVALFALLASGCDEAGPRAVLEIDPPVATVAPGETLAFAAHIRGSDEPVVWEVVEREGGSVDERGRYTAPEREGTFHVTAWVGTADTLRTVEIRVRRPALARWVTIVGRPPPFR